MMSGSDCDVIGMSPMHSRQMDLECRIRNRE